MATRMDRSVLNRLNTLFNAGTIRELTDGQLLERFATGPGEAAELAFAALVERHAPMVMRVCRARLTDPNDAHDAFQAVFLVLVKKARTLWVKDSLGPWLHQVAHRTASCARADAARRRRLERRAVERAVDQEARPDPGWESSLHDEINRLPERYRVPIVLCDLEGHTCEEAARRMGRPVGTVRCWRSRGRDRLRQRLTRLGLAPSVGIAALLSAEFAEASSIKALTETTVRASVGILSGRAMSEGVSASVRILIQGVLKAMLLSKLRASATAIILVSLLATGLGAVARVDPPQESEPRKEGVMPPAPVRPRAVPALENPETSQSWRLTLREAIRIGLENDPNIGEFRYLGPGMTIQVAPSQTDIAPLKFKSDLMARVGSIEELYWRLGQFQSQLQVAEGGIRIAEQVLERLESELKTGRGTTADVAEAAQSVEKLKLNYIAKTSDKITAERNLRNLIGLPPADNREIVVATHPPEEDFKISLPDCLEAMRSHQPDIVYARSRLKRAEARGAHAFASEQESLRSLIDKRSLDMERLHAEVAMKRKLRQSATEFRPRIQNRLTEQMDAYAKGRILPEQLLMVVAEHVKAFSDEAQSKADYEVMVAKLEEAKGTLLEDRLITVAGEAEPTSQGKPAGRHQGALQKPTASVGQAAPTAPPSPLMSPPQMASSTTAEARSAGKTLSFQMTVGGLGARPIEIKGSFSISPVPPTETGKGLAVPPHLTIPPQ